MNTQPAIQLVKPIMLAMILSAFSAFPAVQAQVLHQSTVTVSATVLESGVEGITLQGMDLRNAEAVDGIVTVNPVTSVRAGKLLTIGNPNASFRIIYDSTRELTNTTGPGVIFIEYEVAGNQSNEQETAELFEEENRELHFSASGEYYIWVGGRIDISQATPGSYEGEFTVEIEYI